MSYRQQCMPKFVGNHISQEKAQRPAVLHAHPLDALVEHRDVCRLGGGVALRGKTTGLVRAEMTIGENSHTDPFRFERRTALGSNSAATPLDLDTCVGENTARESLGALECTGRHPRWVVDAHGQD